MAGARRFGIPKKGWQKNVDRKRDTGRGGSLAPEGGWTALTGNTCIVVAPPPLLGFRSRCTRSVYSRDFLEGAAPFEGVPFSGEQSPAAFSRFSKSGVAGIVSCLPRLWEKPLVNSFGLGTVEDRNLVWNRFASRILSLKSSQTQAIQIDSSSNTND